LVPIATEGAKEDTKGEPEGAKEDTEREPEGAKEYSKGEPEGANEQHQLYRSLVLSISCFIDILLHRYVFLSISYFIDNHIKIPLDPWGVPWDPWGFPGTPGGYLGIPGWDMGRWDSSLMALPGIPGWDRWDSGLKDPQRFLRLTLPPADWSGLARPGPVLNYSIMPR